MSQHPLLVNLGKPDADITVTNIICGKPGALWVTALVCPHLSSAILDHKEAWYLPWMLSVSPKRFTAWQANELPQQMMANSLGAMFQAMRSIDSGHGKLFAAAMNHKKIASAFNWIDKYSFCIRNYVPVSHTLTMARAVRDYILSLRLQHKSVTRYHKIIFRLLSCQVMRGCTDESWSLVGEGTNVFRRASDATEVKHDAPLPKCGHTGSEIARRNVVKRCVESFFFQMMIAFACGMTDTTAEGEQSARSFLTIWDLICESLLRYKHRLEMHSAVLKWISDFVIIRMGSLTWLQEVSRHPNIVAFVLHAAEHYKCVAGLWEPCTTFLANMIRNNVSFPNESVRSKAFAIIRAVELRFFEAGDYNSIALMSAVIAARVCNPTEVEFGASFATTMPMLLTFNELLKTYFKKHPLKGICGHVAMILHALTSFKGAIAEKALQIPGLVGCMASIILAGMEVDHAMLAKGMVTEEDIINRWVAVLPLAQSIFGDAIFAYLSDMLRDSTVLTTSKWFGDCKAKMDKWVDHGSEFAGDTDPITTTPVVEPYYLPNNNGMAFNAYTLLNSVWQSGRNPLTNKPLTLVELVAFNELAPQMEKRKKNNLIGILTI